MHIHEGVFMTPSASLDPASGSPRCGCVISASSYLWLPGWPTAHSLRGEEEEEEKIEAKKKFLYIKKNNEKYKNQERMGGVC